MITEFQKKVYDETRKISKGSVRTYAYIAKAIGNPKATRAVGNALNKNPYAPIVPCHRVIKSSGEIGGFASGNRKKIAMLKKEGIKIKNNRIINKEKNKSSFSLHNGGRA